MTPRTPLLVVAALATSLVIDLVVGASVPGRYALVGFLGCLVIILASKRLGRILARPEPGGVDDA